MKARNIRFAMVSLALALLLTPGFSPAVRTPAAWAGAPAIEEAQKLYDSAKFGDAVAKLRDALGTGQVTGSDVITARALMARCLVKAGNRLEAKQAFKTVLRADPAWRPDAVMVPPDEMDVFNLALKEINTEQIEAGQRVPASVSFFYGVGSGDNKDFAKLEKAGGGDDKMKSKAEFGGSVRFPLRPRISLDIELSRFRSAGNDSIPAPNNTNFVTSAIPLVASVYWTAIPGSKHRVNLFAGAGPMLASRASIELPFFTIRLNLADEKVGAYLHAGAEGEWMLSPKLSLNGRVLGRYAKASGLFSGSTLIPYGGSEKLADRTVNFSGFGAFVALRAYIGY